MKSPFPGMDPYLEARWGDVHTSLITYARDQLQPQMPRGLHVRVEEHITIQIAGAGNGDGSPRHGFYPDVRVVERPGGAGAPAAAAAAENAVGVAEPLLVPLELEPQTQRSLEIIDTYSGNRVVTALECLSPTNKSDARGRAAYVQKQRELLQAKVNLVEIDLLRDGPYLLAAPAQVVPLPYLAPYRICVVRASRPHQAEVYRVSLRERLPTFRIPLRESDADARLDLQELIEKAYENGGYDTDIDYRVDPFPTLQGEDALWADGVLRAAGRR
jgi:hypothetical protein